MCTKNVFFALLTTLAFACGGGGLSNNHNDGSSTGDLAGSGNQHNDGSSTQDLSGTSKIDASATGDLGGQIKGTTCGSSTCGLGQVCCVVPDIATKTSTEMCVTGDSCADGGITAACDGPEDCSSTNCCADLVLSGNMMNISGEAMCEATCAPSYGMAPSGGYTVQTKLCHAATDCTNYSQGSLAYSSCCTYPGAPYQFCAPSLLKLLDKNITCE